jgi:hypothetical protein
MFANGVRQKSLSDIGTRYEHLRELSSAWEDGIAVLELRSFVSSEDKDKLKTLKSGVILIDNILTSLGDYHEQVYRVGSEVDRLGDIGAILGGRGTPLSPVKVTQNPAYSVEETIIPRP